MTHKLVEDDSIISILDSLVACDFQCDELNHITRISGNLSGALLYIDKSQLIGQPLTAIGIDTKNLSLDQLGLQNHYRVIDISVDLLRADGSPLPADLKILISRKEDCIIRILRGFIKRIDSPHDAVTHYPESFDIPIIETFPHMVFKIDTNGNIDYLNKQARDELGYPVEDIEMGFHFNRLVHPEDHNRSYEAVRSGLNGSCRKNRGFRILRRNGSILPVDIYSSPIFEDNKPVGLWGIAIDASERKRLELAKKVRNNISDAINTAKNLDEFYSLIRKELSRLIDTENFYVALCDEDTDRIQLPYFVDKRDRFTDMPAGKTLTAYVLKRNKPLLATEKIIDELVESGEIEIFGEKSKVWLGVPLRIDSRIRGIVVVQHYEDPLAYTNDDLDMLKFVSDQIATAIHRKNYEENLRRSEENHRLLIDSAPDGILAVDIETGKYLFANSALCNIIGYTPDEIKGRTVGDLSPDAERKSAREKFRRFIDGLSNEVVEIPMVRKDGSTILVNIRGLRTHFADREVMIGFFRDVTESRKNLNLLKQQSGMLKKLSRRLIEVQEEANRTLSRELHDTVAQTLSVAKIKLENIVHGCPEPGAGNCHEVSSIISEAVTDLRNLSTALRPIIIDQKGLLAAINWYINERCVGVKANIDVTGDQYDLDKNIEINIFRIIQEVMQNICKHSLATEVELGINYATDCFEVNIADNGIGFDVEKTRLNWSEHPSLGLINMRERTALLNGELKIDSHCGKGTAINLKIPIGGKENADGKNIPHR